MVAKDATHDPGGGHTSANAGREQSYQVVGRLMTRTAPAQTGMDALRARRSTGTPFAFAA